MKKRTDKEIAQAIYIFLKDKEGEDFYMALKKITLFFERKKLFTRSSNILKELEKIERTEKKILSVQVVSFSSLTLELQKKIEEVLKNRYKVENILFDNLIDKNLGGGFVLRTNDELIDLSLSGRIKNLKNYLINKI